MFAVNILADSVNPKGNRLTTMEVTYPRCIHAEMLTHRMFSRNSASSRAIPVHKMLKRICQNPFIPIHWGQNQKGMQAEKEVCDQHALQAKQIWLEARDEAVKYAQMLMDLGIHKQIVNRIVEPWMWITVIISATEWENFFKLRCHPDAEPHIQRIAYMMRDAYDFNEPKKVGWYDWHLPLTGFPGDEELDQINLVKISVARCARVSYLTHDGVRDVAADLSLFDRLRSSGHWSPFEHAAQADETPTKIGNFSGWKQYRKFFFLEENITRRV